MSLAGLDVIAHNTDVEEVFELDPAVDDVTEVSIRKGGGTSFEPVCQWIEDRYDDGIDYACVVWFTDMMPWDWSEAAAREPRVPLIWIDWTDCWGDKELPFGDECCGISQ